MICDSAEDHAGVAGLMWVHDEDLDTVAAERGHVECNNCEAVYTAVDGWYVP